MGIAVKSGWTGAHELPQAGSAFNRTYGECFFSVPMHPSRTNRLLLSIPLALDVPMQLMAKKHHRSTSHWIATAALQALQANSRPPAQP